MVKSTGYRKCTAFNGKVIIAKQGLNTKPNVHTIYFDRIPGFTNAGNVCWKPGIDTPNTGLLICEGQSVYEVRFSADLKTNAAVILRRKKSQHRNKSSLFLLRDQWPPSRAGM